MDSPDDKNRQDDAENMATDPIPRPPLNVVESFRNKMDDVIHGAGDPQLMRNVSELTPDSFRGDPSGMREYIENLVTTDTGMALKAVSAITMRCIDRASEGTHKASVIERVSDLIRLLNEMCNGQMALIGVARLKTLLRYMLEPNYTQSTEVIQKIIEGPLEVCDMDGPSTEWRLDLKLGDFAFDLGCGPGKTLDLLEDVAGEGKVHGIDINPLGEIGDPRVHIGVIDTSQEKIADMDNGTMERLSFKDDFGKGGLVFASLVIDRVANQAAFLMNCKKILRPGGTFALSLLLPVRCEDDEPNLASRIKYSVDPLTVGDDAETDYGLIVDHLTEIGFVNIRRCHMPIKDPVSGGTYENHYVIVAQKKED